ncbi:hypothetical protein [Thalassobacillus pellis]|uniref:hypothetical protein n=1 Tax=Thalassobacillus pellis TaxID=748008 RepID=UPI001961F87D|nr:hypothetical protein [Thalassobacillus pellis]MBM7551264.1 hypothetical protein [Thalassobacillus pellis]
MLQEHVLAWQEQVACRKDLLPRWKKRSLLICFDNLHQTVQICVTNNHIETERARDYLGRRVTLKGHPEVIAEVLEGKKQLTKIPTHLIQIQGAYRDILFLESLFLLGR